jgi:hypothetical protein
VRGGRDVQAVAVRRLAACVLSGVFAVSWCVPPGFGGIDLSVTWNAEWPQVLEAGWGLFATVIVGASFAWLAVRPGVSVPVVGQLVVATACLALSAVVAREPGLFALVVLLALQTAIVGGLLGSTLRHETASRVPGLSRSLLLVGGVGVIPWLAYALRMWSLNRDGRSDSDVTLGVDHYSVQGALALVLALLPLWAGLRTNVFVPVCAGIAASYLGLVSLAWPDAEGALGQAWSIAAIVWGLALLATTVTERIRAVRLDPERQRPDLVRASGDIAAHSRIPPSSPSH